ncbi:MAG: hypothetical protein B6U78_02405 [Candidatus Aenigmarchaeota archaeon ex4484_224]|nr:MAG: hypothetical protein B6U78_02405 [Candidatus Aenigmarchaeota archaeon ex4484_224]
MVRIIFERKDVRAISGYLHYIYRIKNYEEIKNLEIPKENWILEKIEYDGANWLKKLSKKIKRELFDRLEKIEGNFNFYDEKSKIISIYTENEVYFFKLLLLKKKV